ncbi:2,3-bisphosphoglycerate-independent phosphoglycerate mutase [Planctomycetota bacterium]|nr:2,3-bisphosphoglycerate-independent phosphoglycerate mutase [Planctomycetota bacterium]
MTLALPGKPVLIVVRDGWGVREDPAGNAVAMAKTPRHDDLWKRFPTALVNASEHFVGLPAGQMGNSEVGHLNMGAGRVVFQDFARIENAVREGTLIDTPLREAMDRATERNRCLHLVGLCSDGGVHSHLRHLRALLEMAKGLELEDVAIHAITDGRDTDPQGGVEYLRQVVAWTQELGVGRIASVAGRYYTMDRDKRWDRVQLGYDAMVLGKGPKATDPIAVLEASYAAGKGDEFVIPTVITDSGRPTATFQRGDQVIAFNFRADRMRQICNALASLEFTGFERGTTNVFEMVGMTRYDTKIPFRGVAFAPQTVKNHIAALVAEQGLSQFKCAETEKYAHITFFWNGGVEAACPGEERHLIPSPRVATYDLQPEMHAQRVADAVTARLGSHTDALMVVNFANTDMVGHTGDIDAAVRAVEVVDSCVGQIVEAMLAKGGAAIITADHGNCEMMRDPDTGRVHTAHTTCPVHAVICDSDSEGQKARDGQLADLAPTALKIMGLELPPEMTGSSLLG